MTRAAAHLQLGRWPDHAHLGHPFVAGPTAGPACRAPARCRMRGRPVLGHAVGLVHWKAQRLTTAAAPAHRRRRRRRPCGTAVQARATSDPLLANNIPAQQRNGRAACSAWLRNVGVHACLELDPTGAAPRKKRWPGALQVGMRRSPGSLQSRCACRWRASPVRPAGAPRHGQGSMTGHGRFHVAARVPAGLRRPGQRSEACITPLGRPVVPEV